MLPISWLGRWGHIVARAAAAPRPVMISPLPPDEAPTLIANYRQSSGACIDEDENSGVRVPIRWDGAPPSSS